MLWFVSEQNGRSKERARPVLRMVLLLVVAVVSTSSGIAFAETLRRIGYVTMDSASTHALFGAAFRQGLRDSGYTEGQNATILWRFAANNASLLPGLMSEMISQKVDLLVADTTQAALAAQHATRSIPIVVPTSGDLLGVGLVENLAKPAGNLTGFTLMSGGLIGKRLALLKEMAPRTTRVAVLMNPDNPAGAFQLKEAQTAVEVTAPTVIALTGYGQAEDRKRTKEARL